MAKVLLLSPPYVDLYGKLSKAAGRYFPLGLAYIASYLRKYGGHDVRMYEPEAQELTYADIAGIIKREDPDFVGLTCSTPNFHRALELAQLCRENSRAKVILGGVHATALPEFIVERYSGLVDCVVVGEGEETMLALVEAYEKGAPLEEVQGIAFLKDGKAARTACRPFVEDMDSIPFPARDLIPQDLFRPNTHNARHRKCATILTSRGCPYNCSFCAARLVSGKKYRMHSAEYVLEEMEMLKRDYGARQLVITDDTFTMNRKRLEEICRGMIERKLGFEWFCFSQVTTVNREILKLMRRAGCYNIGFGVEAASPAVLKRMGKNITPEKAVETVGYANELGMKTQAFYVFGTPGETRQEMEDTVRLAKRVNSTMAFFNMLVPYPGTKDFEHFFSGMSLSDIDWKNFVAIGENCVLDKNTEVSGTEIEKIIGRANLQYYLNPKRALALLFHIRTLYEFENYAVGGLSFLKQIFSWLDKKAQG